MRGVTHFQNFILLLEFNEKFQNFYFLLLDYQDLKINLRIQFSDQIIKSFIEEIQRSFKIHDDSQFFNLENIRFKTFYSVPYQERFIVIILYYKISSLFLYIEFDLQQSSIVNHYIKNVAYKNKSKKSVQGFREIKTVKEMIIFFTTNDIFVVKKDYFVKNIATLEVYQYKLNLGSYNQFDKVDYLGDNLYLLSNKDNYSIFNIGIQGQYISKSQMMEVTTIHCDHPYVSIVESKFFACLYFQRSLQIQYLIVKQYYIQKGAFELINTIRLQIHKEFFMSEKNFHYFFDEFQNSLIIFFNEYVIIF